MFEREGRKLGLAVERIGKKDLPRLAEFDALFIRETTGIEHHTFRFAKKAAAEGLVVIDDPDSIIRCANKVYLAELLRSAKIPRPNTRILSRGSMQGIAEELGYPVVLKIPDGSFSRGVVRAQNAAELARHATELFRESDLILAQEYLFTDFDWRIGVLDREPLFACRYYMVQGHWQIADHSTPGRVKEGASDCVPIGDVPPAVLALALTAANRIGDGLYGIDLKQVGDRVLVIEVNDNPNIDFGVEDAVLGAALYRRVMESFLRRLEKRSAGER
jgi:glutathione synthase/RimK-type ligase-like ATP-grasp enzyme